MLNGLVTLASPCVPTLHKMFQQHISIFVAGLTASLHALSTDSSLQKICSTLLVTVGQYLEQVPHFMDNFAKYLMNNTSDVNAVDQSESTVLQIHEGIFRGLVKNVYPIENARVYNTVSGLLKTLQVSALFSQLNEAGSNPLTYSTICRNLST